MGAIPATEARSIYTKALVAIYQERIAPKSFLRSFFRVEEKGSKYLSIEVQRGTELVAVDVLRGTEGNRNIFSKSTEKIFEPPYYREFFDATQLDLYDRMFTPNGVVSEDMVSDFVSGIKTKMDILIDKIERAYEKQAAQVFETGVVTLVRGGSIDYKRKAASLVNTGAGTYWTEATVNPADQIEAGAVFLRETGKSSGDFVNVIMGATAFRDMKANTKFKEQQNLFNMALDSIAPPQRNSLGASLQGRMSIGSYNAIIWTYPESYETSPGTNVPYMNPKNIVVLPEKTNFVHGFAAVQQLLTTGGVQNVKGAYKIGEKMDPYHAVHEFDVKSAGLMIPVAVDQIYTRKVVA